MNRRSTAEPPERNSSTLIPVSAWNTFAIFWAVLTGVEVYQVTAASRLAAARSTGSGVNAVVCAAAGAASHIRAKQATRVSVRVTRSSPSNRPGKPGAWCFVVAGAVHATEPARPPQGFASDALCYRASARLIAGGGSV